MCGKFTAMYSWAEVHEFSSMVTRPAEGKDKGGVDGGGNDDIATYRVSSQLPVIVWDPEARKRKVIAMRWGFPSSTDWRRPKPIHARAETVEKMPAFAQAFRDGQRGIVVFRTFNEAKEIKKPSGATTSEQWTIDPMDGVPRGFAFVWRSFDIPGQDKPLLACVMVTVPASALVRTIARTDDDDPRMPAILEDEEAWDTWLGARSAETADVKAVLKTMEGVNWTIAPEPKAPKKK